MKTKRDRDHNFCFFIVFCIVTKAIAYILLVVLEYSRKQIYTNDFNNLGRYCFSTFSESFISFVPAKLLVILLLVATGEEAICCKDT